MFTPDQIIQLLIAALSGGALLKFIENAGQWLLYNRGKSVRDELRTEIQRLETRINQLEAEVERQKKANDDWRDKYNTLQLHAQRLEITVEAKDFAISVLEERVRRLRTAVNCQFAENCPLIHNEEVTEDGYSDDELSGKRTGVASSEPGLAGGTADRSNPADALRPVAPRRPRPPLHRGGIPEQRRDEEAGS